MLADEKLERGRQPGCCAKMAYFFCRQAHKSHLETYLELKKSQGQEADYSVIDNESILKQYGIEIPSSEERTNDQQPNGLAVNSEQRHDGRNGEVDEETKHLLRA